jgi:hypothetical protein
VNFTADQSEKYYESRISTPIRKVGTSYKCLCPFHDETNPSFALDFKKGSWYCHTEGIGGGMVDFEMRLNAVTASEAAAAVGVVMGLSDYAFAYSGKPEATYQYHDEQGKLLYEVQRTRDPRTGRKRITNRRPVGKNGWEYTLEGTRRVLYHLQEVLKSDQIYIVEGEKCADAVREAFGEEIHNGITATTSPHGAGKWRDEFAPYFTGKRVVVIPDNDVPGRDHMQQVAASVARYALGVKWLDLPLDSEKDDVADYLEGHSFSDLVALTKKAPLWRRKDDAGLLVPAHDFMRHVSPVVDWRVEGVIEKGTSGFIIALPKGGKSFSTVDLAVSLATGASWLDCRVSEPTRVALVSREDGSGLTARRIKRVITGRGLDLEDPIWETNLLVNTREQSPNLALEDDAQVAELIHAMQAKKIEFCILDVLNVLHDADENDNTEMRRVLSRVSHIRKEVGCQICIVHHGVKDWDENKTLSQLARGSSAIAGFAEFIIGVRMVDEETQTRQMRFETKSSEPLPSFYWKIIDKADGGATLERVEYEDKRKTTRHRLSVLTKEA